MLFPIFWVEQRVKVSEPVISELRTVRAILDWGGTVCACAAILFASYVTIATCCAKKSQYSKPQEMIVSEKPKDEAEMKLNSMQGLRQRSQQRKAPRKGGARVGHTPTKTGLSRKEMFS
ncbi:jg1231 [Pararge aegeria aegeria]|uniref:Jg1231 protein n=1 Tax=Pararge aegeria aegeria TaxID=348720 RepID=A0A8S4QWR0_9NEOP|nr:jg1231 [Pararge aegeria aegeria]